MALMRAKDNPSSQTLGGPATLSIVTPTFNEAGNVVELRDRIARSLEGVRWELIVVDDDSPDGSADVVRAMAQQDQRVRCVHRIERRGLASACIEGILSSSAPIVAVIDADLQHDERLLPAMLRALGDDPDLDAVVGSRYAPGGETGEWAATRVRQSRLATALARRVLRTPLADPMSGFFMMRRHVALDSIREGLSSIGFKVLFDLLAAACVPVRCLELPYTFKVREHGESKLDAAVVWDFAIMLLDRFLGRRLPARFLSFAAVGALGVVTHMVALWATFVVAEVSFPTSQTIATLVALTGNFSLHNLFTYRDRRLRGFALVGGWVTFALASLLGSLANVGIATHLFASEAPWAASALAGIAVGTVWNYALGSAITWRPGRTRTRNGVMMGSGPPRPATAGRRG